jgi:exodeoxyribonuclease VII small subunit
MAAKKSSSETSTEPLNFETALSELNQLVEKMEQGGLSLEQSLSFFERGIQLTRQCQQALESAEQKVRILVDKNGKESLQSFQENE